MIRRRYTTGMIPIGFDPLYTHCRIDFDCSEKWRPLQRHVWFKPDGSMHVEEWIPTLPSWTEATIAASYKPLSRKEDTRQ